jgi:single-stranded DNA-binding protein
MYFGTDCVELAAQLAPGAKVYVEGKLKLNNWQAADGTTRTGLNAKACGRTG